MVIFTAGVHPRPNVAQTLEERCFIPQIKGWLSLSSTGKTRRHATVEAIDNHTLARGEASLTTV